MQAPYSLSTSLQRTPALPTLSPSARFAPKASHSASTQPGDLIVFFSDGIVDAGNSHGEMFGSDRLIELLQRHPTARQSAQDAVNAILEAVSEFRAGNDHFDDETVVVVRVT